MHILWSYGKFVEKWEYHCALREIQRPRPFGSAQGRPYPQNRRDRDEHPREFRWGAEFSGWGTQIRHLARIFTVDKAKNEELNSFRRVSPLIREHRSRCWIAREETLPRS